MAWDRATKHLVIELSVELPTWLRLNRVCKAEYVPRIIIIVLNMAGRFTAFVYTILALYLERSSKYEKMIQCFYRIYSNADNYVTRNHTMNQVH